MGEPLEVPRLAAGGGLLLRPWEMGDVSLVAEVAGDDYIPLITTIPAVYTPEAAQEFVRRQWDRAQTGHGYSFVIERTADRRPLGSIGLWLHDISAGRASLGYWLTGAARGHRVAAAALRATVHFGLDRLRIPRLELYVEPWNTASLRTAERAGFRREGLLRSWQQVGAQRRDMVMFALLATDADLESG